MKIDRTNYEVFFIDLLDGALSGKALDEVLDFLQENPDLADELKNLEEFQLPSEQAESIHYQYLQKSDFDHPDVLQETCIRAIENELSGEEEAAFTQYINTHPKAKNDYRLFQATISKPDLQVVYPDKAKLKRTRSLVPIWYSVAAVVLLGFFFWFTNQREELHVQTAQQTKVETKEPALVSKIVEPANVDPKLEKEVVAEAKPVNIDTGSTENLAIRSVETMQPLVPINIIEVYTSDIQYLAELAPVKVKQTEEAENQQIFPTIPELIAQQISKFSFRLEASKLGKAALDRISIASNDKLTYKTNGKGNVEKIEFSSKLLAFSFPVSKEEQ